MENFKFGKKPAVNDYRTLKLSKYVMDVLDPPATFDNLATVYQKTAVNDPRVLYPIDGNDVYGDCVCAGLAHAITTYSGLINKFNVPSSADVIRLYKRLTCCRGDVGLNMLDTLKKWRKKTFLGDQILAFAKIDPKNHKNVMQSVWLFGGVYFGFNVQENAIEDFENRIAWTPGNLTNAGHCVFLTTYTDYLTLLTWGDTQDATWSWWDETVDEAYAIIPPEAKDPAFAPGFAYEELLEDLQVISQ